MRRREVSAIGPWERALRLPRSGGVLVFDGYCGFCTRSVHGVLRLDRRGRVRALPLQGTRVLALAGLSRAQALREAWWIGADGRRAAGAGAVASALAAATGLPLWHLYRVPGLRAVADRGYRWVAEHRRSLRGTTPHCVAHPGCGSDAEPSCSG